MNSYSSWQLENAKEKKNAKRNNSTLNFMHRICTEGLHHKKTLLLYYHSYSRTARVRKNSACLASDIIALT